MTVYIQMLLKIIFVHKRLQTFLKNIYHIFHLCSQFLLPENAHVKVKY